MRDARTDAELLWTADFFGTVDQPRGQTGFWRPVILWTFRLEHVLAGRSEAGYLWLGHCLTILCHAAAALALWRLLLVLDLAPAAALLAAAVFAVHPVHVESVAWASGRVSSLPTALAWGATAVWLGRGRHRMLTTALVVASFTLALLGKETAVVLVGLAALLARVKGRSWREALAVPTTALVLALLLRALLFGLARELNPSAYTGPAATSTRWMTWLAVLPELLRLLLWVGPATPIHPFAPVSSFEPAVAAGLATGVVAALLAWLAWRRRLAAPILAAGLVVGTLLVLAPWARYPVGFADAAAPLYDRYVYAMAAAPCVLVAWLLRSWLATSRVRVLLVVAAVTVPVGLVTASRVPVWSSDEAFARAGLTVAPASADLLNQLGYALLRTHLETGRPGADTQALATFDRALAVDPEHRLANLNRFLVLRALRRDEAADAAARMLLARWPEDPHVLDNVAGFEASRGRLVEAIELFERELATGEPLPGATEAMERCLEVLMAADH